MNKKEEIIQLLEQALDEFESSKGSTTTGIRKLFRVAHILGNDKVKVWCKIQLGNHKYTGPLKKCLELYIKEVKEEEYDEEELEEAKKEIEKLGIYMGDNFKVNQTNYLINDSSGGFHGIGFIEEKYSQLTKQKKGNDGTYYISNLNAHINYIEREAHEYATSLYNQIAFSQAPKTAFDFLKEEVDDKLLDINPEIAEKLMLSFKSVNSGNPEEWSQALTSCRRLIEDLADELFPPSTEKYNGREVGKAQYINRLWAFMDLKIESKSNKKLAKAHVDILGKYLERVHKMSNKGVHSDLDQSEAIKSMFHAYLMLADILNYIDDEEVSKNKNINIHKATLDELQSFMDISKAIAKEIIKLRVQNEVLTLKRLSEINGIGLKTLKKAKDSFSFSSIENQKGT